jgi:hypothetical protein
MKVIVCSVVRPTNAAGATEDSSVNAASTMRSLRSTVLMLENVIDTPFTLIDATPSKPVPYSISA